MRQRLDQLAANKDDGTPGICGDRQTFLDHFRA